MDVKPNRIPYRPFVATTGPKAKPKRYEPFKHVLDPKNLQTCLNCTNEDCDGYCEVYKRKRRRKNG